MFKLFTDIKTKETPTSLLHNTLNKEFHKPKDNRRQNNGINF